MQESCLANWGLLDCETLRRQVTVQIYSGGSVGGAAMMNEEKTDICLNWAGAYPAYCCLLICHAHQALTLIDQLGAVQTLRGERICGGEKYLVLLSS